MEGRHPIEHMKFTIPSANILKDTEKLILLTGRKLLSHDEFEKVIDKSLVTFPQRKNKLCAYVTSCRFYS